MNSNLRVVAAFVAIAIIGPSVHAAASDDASAGQRKALSAYTGWLRSCVLGLKHDVPVITRSADAAAGKFVSDGWSLGAYGDGYFVSEVSGRAGGIMPLVDPAGATGPCIVLLSPRTTHLDEDFIKALQFAARGDMVILFARRSLLELAAKAEIHAAAAIDTHASPNGGLVQRDGSWLVPTDSPASIAAVWTWTAEFVAACTRRGRMVAMWQSIMVPGSAERNKRVAGARFDPVPPSPIAPGVLAAEYLQQLDRNIQQVFVGERQQILSAISQADRVRSRGGALYTYLFGHATMLQPGLPGDPGLFQKMYRDWFQPEGMDRLTSRDLVLGIGYDGVLHGDTFGSFAEQARKSGAALVWSFTDYKADEVKGVLPGETYIDQRWPIGDAVVAVPGYDVRILPTSGVITCGLYWAINFGVLASSAHPGRQAPEAATPVPAAQAR